MKIHLLNARGASPNYHRVVWIEFRLLGKDFTIQFPLPYLEVYTYRDVPDSPLGDIEPFRLLPPDRWWRNSPRNPNYRLEDETDERGYAGIDGVAEKGAGVWHDHD